MFNAFDAKSAVKIIQLFQSGKSTKELSVLFEVEQSYIEEIIRVGLIYSSLFLTRD